MLEKCVIRSRSRISRRNGHRTLQVAPMIMCMFSKITEKLMKQECIPVGCVPPACWPYHPLVDHIPACIARGVPAGGCTCPGGCTCQGGVPVGGVYLPEGCTCPGGVPARGRGCTCWGCTCPGGVPVLSCTWAGTPPLWTEWLSDRCKNINFANLFCGR